MKKIILIFAVVTTLVSCTTEDTADLSKVTNYATLTVTGDAVVVLNTDDTYTDAGAVANAGGEPVDVVSNGSVDTSAPGVYKINYQAFNDDGFAVNGSRTVIVLDSAPSSINLEGTFFRNGNANNVTRLSDRMYICDNATGYNVENDKITLTFYNIDDEHVYAPFQENTSGSGLSAESAIGNIYNNDHWDWVIFASGVFGTAVRDFTR